MEQPLEFFPYKCPHCSNVRNAADVAKELPVAVLRLAAGRHVATLRRTRLAGPGRPKMARCPGCSQEMPAADLRDHRIPCVSIELKSLQGLPIQLTPKDPDPHPTFYLHSVTDTEAHFQKASNHDLVTVDLRKIAEISKTDQTAYVRVLGRITWHDDIKRWRFAPTAAIGRPPKPTEA